MYKAGNTNSEIQLKDENKFLYAFKGKALIF